MPQNRFVLLYGACLLASLLLALFYAQHQVVTYDQTQMLANGYLGAREGQWANFGNAHSSFAPAVGPLSAWIVGAPLLLWDSPWAPMLLLLALRLAALLLLDSAIARLGFGRHARLALLLGVALNPWFLYDSLLYNPAYLCFFAALHLWSGVHMRAGPNFLASALHILATGLAVQLHYSGVLLALISLFLFWRGALRVHWRGALFAAAAVVAMLLPALLTWREHVGEGIGLRDGRYIGRGAAEVGNVLKTMAYWFRYGSTFFSNRIIEDAHFLWLAAGIWNTALTYIWQGILFAAGAASAALAVHSNWIAARRAWPLLKRNRAAALTDTAPQHWLLRYAAAALFACVFCAALSPITFSYWHLIAVFPFALIPLLLRVEHWRTRFGARRWARVLAVLALFFALVNAAAALGSRNDKYSYRANYAAQVQAWLADGYPDPVIPPDKQWWKQGE